MSGRAGLNFGGRLGFFFFSLKGDRGSKARCLERAEGGVKEGVRGAGRDR